MLTLFASMDLVRSDQGTFRVTPKAREFLVREAPLFMGAYFAALKDRPVCRDFIHVLRNGKPANWGSFKDGKDWAKAMESDDFARTFTAAMDCRGRILGRALAEQLDVTGGRRLLDVAGGSGIYACMILARHPQMNATVFEKPPVDQVAARAVAALGMSGAVLIAAGDMFRDDWPAGHDMHLLSNVLHDWDGAEVRRLLERSYEALPPGGRLVIHDAWIHGDKTGPLPVAMYSCLLMHSSEGKCYSMAEIRSLAGRTGFEDFQFTPTVLDRGYVTAHKPS
jgi:acetylserotonin N-methyltransferase